MRILLLGATGRTGKLVLQKALENGHQVNCLSRKTERIAEQNGLTVWEGDPTREADLLKASEACEAIISVLNISRKSDFPWASLRTPETFLSDVMKLLVSVAEKRNIKRMAVCSAWGVAETRNDIPKWFKWFIDHSNIGIAYKDHERQEQIITESNLDWTIVRPVGLSNSRRIERIRETFDSNPTPNLLISRHSVAQYLVESLEQDHLMKRKVVISKE